MPLEHGYPPAEVTLSNVHRFAPIAGAYYGKVVKKFAPHLGKSGTSSVASSPGVTETYADLIHEENGQLLQAPRLLATGLLDEKKLLTFLNPPNLIGGPTLEQWQRLVSLEYTLQKFDR